LNRNRERCGSNVKYFFKALSKNSTKQKVNE
jgi:hypothetical protein